MSTAARFLVPAAWAIACVVAACTSASTQPPELGNCVKVADAACADPNTGGGGGGPSSGGEGGTTSSSGSSSGAAGCGTVDGLISSVTSNVDCIPCIEGTLDGGGAGCCQAAGACTGDCVTYASCVQACSAGDTTCIGNCQNQYPTGITNYDQYATCVSQDCTPECPTLNQ
ncbi:MAG TPA: hypothetical protein VGG39_14130 [Polyangiaceae bacterium]